VCPVLVPDAERAAVMESRHDPPVIRPRAALHSHLDLTAHARHDAQQLAGGPELSLFVAFSGHRHEVEEPQRAGVGPERRLPNVGRADVPPHGGEPSGGADGKMPAASGVE